MTPDQEAIDALAEAWKRVGQIFYADRDEAAQKAGSEMLDRLRSRGFDIVRKE